MFTWRLLYTWRAPPLLQSKLTVHIYSPVVPVNCTPEKLKAVGRNVACFKFMFHRHLDYFLSVRPSGTRSDAYKPNDNLPLSIVIAVVFGMVSPITVLLTVPAVLLSLKVFH